MPPAKVSVTRGVDELQVVTVADRRAIDQKVLEENFVLRLLIIKSKVVFFGVRRLVAGFTSGALPHGRATAPVSTGRASITKLEQSPLNLSHACDGFKRKRCLQNHHVELIAKQ